MALSINRGLVMSLIEKAKKEYEEAISAGIDAFCCAEFQTAIRQAKAATERANGKVGLEAKLREEN